VIFQSILIATLCLLAFYAFVQRYKSPFVAIIISIFSLIGLVFAIAPSISNDVAHVVGIGRGADLIVYCFIMITFASILNIHLRLRAHQDQITELARAITLAGATEPSTSPEL
jgi:small membrane protein